MDQLRALSLSLLSALALVFLFTGCDSLTSSEESTSSQVRLQFSTATSSTQTSTLAAKSSADRFVVEGTNGTLTITDVRFIVEKFKLEKADDACDALEGEDEEACEEFEAPPSFVDLPLDGSVAPVAAADIPAGIYEELEFEVEDIDIDEEADEDDGGAEFAALVTEIRAAYPDWPEDASMVIEGTFTPTGGSAQPFMTFAEAELEVEMEFDTPLEITEAGASEAVTVNVAPELWFANADGSVIDLSAYDFGPSEELLEFELKMKEGFTSVEREEDDDEDDEEEDDDDEEQDDGEDDD